MIQFVSVIAFEKSPSAQTVSPLRMWHRSSMLDGTLSLVIVTNATFQIVLVGSTVLMDVSTVPIPFVNARVEKKILNGTTV